MRSSYSKNLSRTHKCLSCASLLFKEKRIIQRAHDQYEPALLPTYPDLTVTPEYPHCSTLPQNKKMVQGSDGEHEPAILETPPRTHECPAQVGPRSLQSPRNLAVMLEYVHSSDLQKNGSKNACSKPFMRVCSSASKIIHDSLMSGASPLLLLEALTGA